LETSGAAGREHTEEVVLRYLPCKPPLMDRSAAFYLTVEESEVEEDVLPHRQPEVSQLEKRFPDLKQVETERGTSRTRDTSTYFFEWTAPIPTSWFSGNKAPC
jgi:hypothetical protein